MRAWSRLNGHTDSAFVVDILKESPKTSVYRLRTLGLGMGAVVAKRTSPESGELERLVYSQVLPLVAGPKLRLFGAMPESSISMWLFLEDAGDRPFDPGDAHEQCVAGELLAALHGTAIAREMLPDRGVTSLRNDLDAARKAIHACFVRDRVADHDAHTLDLVGGALEEVNARFGAIVAGLSVLPAVFVHGDLSPKNMRRMAGRAPSIVFLDWEVSGFGFAGVDIASLFPRETEPGLNAYIQRAVEAWPGLQREDLIRAHRAGRVCRLVTSIRWAADTLTSSHFQRIVANYLAVYEPLLVAALRQMESA